MLGVDLYDGYNVNATNYGSGNGPADIPFVIEFTCFLAGTRILMANNTWKPIELVKAGEYVLSFDFVSHLYLPKLVTKILVHQSSEYWLINNKLPATPNHKLWVNDILSTVGNIKRGDYLRNENYEKVWVFDIQKFRPGHTFKTYNFKVADTHNYLAEGLLVHNKCPFVYSSYNGVETCHGTILTNFNGIENKNIDTLKIMIPFDKIIIREIEPETTIFNNVWIDHTLLATDVTIHQGEELIFNVNCSSDCDLIAKGYYTPDEEEN